MAGDWEAQAVKYRLEEDATGNVELSFFLGQNEIHAVGQFMGDVLPDGAMHREPVRLKEARRWFGLNRTQMAVRSSSR